MANDKPCFIAASLKGFVRRANDEGTDTRTREEVNRAGWGLVANPIAVLLTNPFPKWRDTGVVGDRNRVNVIENFSAFCSPPHPSFARSFFLPAISALSQGKTEKLSRLNDQFCRSIFPPPPYLIQYFTRIDAIFSIEKKISGYNACFTARIRDSQRKGKEKKKKIRERVKYHWLSEKNRVINTEF